MRRPLISPWTTARAVATGWALMSLGSATAAAESCLEQVRQLAARHGVSIDLPMAAPNEPPGTPAPDLGRSGGVIEPPATPDKSVITPPRDLRYGMPTLPDVKPPAKDSAIPRAAPGATPDGRLDLTTLQSLLVAARGHAERGNEAECREGVAKARELSARP